MLQGWGARATRAAGSANAWARLGGIPVDGTPPRIALSRVPNPNSGAPDWPFTGQSTRHAGTHGSPRIVKVRTGEYAEAIDEGNRPDHPEQPIGMALLRPLAASRFTTSGAAPSWVSSQFWVSSRYLAFRMRYLNQTSDIIEAKTTHLRAISVTNVRQSNYMLIATPPGYPRCNIRVSPVRIVRKVRAMRDDPLLTVYS